MGTTAVAALVHHLDRALVRGGRVTVDLTGACVEDPLALAGALRNKARLRLVY